MERLLNLKYGKLFLKRTWEVEMNIFGWKHVYTHLPRVGLAALY